MNNPPLILDTSPNKIKSSKRNRKRTKYHHNHILYHKDVANSKVTNIWEIDLIYPPHRAHTTFLESTMTFLLNRFTSVSILSYRICQEKIIILKGFQLPQDER